MQERRVQRKKDDGSWVDIPFAELKKGDTFRLIDPPDGKRYEDGAVEYLAQSDAAPYENTFGIMADAIGLVIKQTEPAIAKLTDHQLLHLLWTKAVRTERYNKQEWMELEARFLHGRNRQ